jgi:hypothetical protein
MYGKEHGHHWPLIFCLAEILQTLPQTTGQNDMLYSMMYVQPSTNIHTGDGLLCPQKLQTCVNTNSAWITSSDIRFM